MSTAHNFNSPISCHAFNADCTEVALSLNSREVFVYAMPKTSGGKFQLLDCLSEHTANVTGVDWATKTNRIVTCAADRNAYVWTQVDGKWKPTLVILQINRAATCVRWSPKEDKFAVGSAARMISVCYFEEEQNWWVSKHIKKPIRSTITCLDWHPNNVLLACGSTDFRARVFSSYMKQVDEKPSKTAWGQKMNFANLMFDHFIHGGWIHNVSFSGDGDKLAWVSHDSSISVVDAKLDFQVTTVRHQFLPFIALEWLGQGSLLAAGHDCSPMLFCYTGPNGLTFSQQIDVKSEAKSAKISAMKKFQDIDKMATSEDIGSQLQTLHQNTISEIRIMRGSKNRAEQISSIGKDGLLVIWDLRTLEQRIAGLKIQ